MTTYQVTLDLTADELADLRAALITADAQLTRTFEDTDAALSVRALTAAKIRSLRIVRQQLRTATRNDHDGGPVGTARYAIR